ncbi:hypothetical protein [Halochromatium roseum]|uniref:hypothetical protein n=1 Tax=Halochromatium roseum TaxID=391920 RepID=UPI001912DC4C|nr:hypothetical protein [Halochromatium roseum]
MAAIGGGIGLQAIMANLAALDDRMPTITALHEAINNRHRWHGAAKRRSRPS